MSQWAKLLGLTVIGTVSSEAKAEVARKHGCDHAILYTREDVAKRVRELTNGVGASVVYDSVGKDTFAGSIDSLKRRAANPDLLIAAALDSDPEPSGKADDVIEIWRRASTLKVNIKLDSFRGTSELVAQQTQRLLDAYGQTELAGANP